MMNSLLLFSVMLILVLFASFEKCILNYFKYVATTVRCHICLPAVNRWDCFDRGVLSRLVPKSHVFFDFFGHMTNRNHTLRLTDLYTFFLWQYRLSYVYVPLNMQLCDLYFTVQLLCVCLHQMYFIFHHCTDTMSWLIFRRTIHWMF